MSRHLKIAFLVVALIAITAIIWNPIRRAYALSALQQSVSPRGSVTVGFHSQTWYDETLDDSLLAYLPFRTRVGPKQPQVRLRILLGDAVNLIHVDLPDSASARHAALLARFPQLEQISYREDEHGSHAPEQEWVDFISVLAAQAGLRSMYFNGHDITDASLLPLARHETLEDISVNSARLTPACLSTFASMPQLRFVGFENYAALGEHDWIALCAAVRQMSGLHGVVLGGDELSDAALAELAGHPSLRRVVVLGHKLTPACAGSLAAISRLDSLVLSTSIPPFTHLEREAIISALPGVRVEFLKGGGVRFK